MGAKLSTQPAEDKAEQAQKTIDEVLKSLQDKRQLYLLEISKDRGENAQNKNTEVTGGRTISEYSQIFYTEKIGPNSEITEAMNDFFKAADSSIDGDNQGAKHAAIQGAKSLIMAAIDGIMGSTSIGVQEVQSFSVVFMNNSFVRLDYRFFQQNIDVVKYLAGVRSTARLIVCEIAVLPIQDMKPAEISYLLSQAFDLQATQSPEVGFANLGKIQTGLIQLSVLTAMLQSVLKEEESEDDTGQNNTSSIENRSKALIQISESVSQVLQDIQKKLPPPDAYKDATNGSNYLLLGTARSAEYETEIKDTYNDMDRQATHVASWFLKQIEIFKNASDPAQMQIQSKAMALLKNTYLDYAEAFMDAYSHDDENGISWTTGYKKWYNESKYKFAFWWFNFERKVDAMKDAKKIFNSPKDKVKNLKGEGDPSSNGDGNASTGTNSTSNDEETLLDMLLKYSIPGIPETSEVSADDILKRALDKVNEDRNHKLELDSVPARKMKKALSNLDYPEESPQNPEESPKNNKQ